MKRLILAGLLLASTAAHAQNSMAPDPHAGHSMSATDPHAGHQMPANDPHAGHDAAMVDPHAGHTMPTTDPHAGHQMQADNPHAGHGAAMDDPHAGHSMPASDPHAGHGQPPAVSAIGNAPAPQPPTDRAADRFFPAATMAVARAALLREHGGMTVNQLMIDIAEARPGKGADSYAWNGEAWIGGDIDRLALKSEGEGSGTLGQAEVQALWSHALDAYWNFQLGVRQDIRPRPGRSYAVIGVEGLAPYWFEVDANIFLSNKGDLSARIEAYYDQRLTQRLILQPRVGLDFAFSDDKRTGVGSGLGSAEAGVRLRYEFSRRFAPYVGLVHERRFGETGRLAIASGESRRGTRAVLGLRAWF
ncbi:MAG: copper resistance protein B [Alphaproteobacteria bacterium]